MTKMKKILNTEYRSNDAEPEYYISQILSVINPTHNKFGQMKWENWFSNIYSITDEAYELLVIYNGHHMWKEQKVMKHNGIEGTMMKKQNVSVQEIVRTSRDGLMLAWIFSIPRVIK